MLDKDMISAILAKHRIEFYAPGDYDKHPWTHIDEAKLEAVMRSAWSEAMALRRELKGDEQ